MTPNALDALKEQREQLWSCIDALLEVNASLRADIHAVRAELARVRRNHLRRMAHVAWLRRDYPRSTPISFCRRGQYDRFAIACNSAALANNAKDEA